MKTKLIILFLALCLLCGCVATPSGGESSAETSSAENSETENSKSESSKSTTSKSESSAAQESSEPPFVSAEVKANIDALLSNDVDRSLQETNLIAGKKYTLSSDAATQYPDDKKLTDGKLAAGTFSTSGKAGWVGFNYTTGASVSIEIDMGKVVSGAADFRVGTCSDLAAGIGLFTVDYYIASGDEDYILLATVKPSRDASDGMKYLLEAKLQGSVSFSRLKIVCRERRSSWIFIDEISVIKYEETGMVYEDGYYPKVSLPEVDEQLYWDEGEADYSKKVNLLLGLKASLEASDQIAETFTTEQYNTRNDMSALTDGKRSVTPNYSASGLFRMTQGGWRNIYFDLGALSSVESFAGSFLEQSSTGVHPPERVFISVSEDGKTWNTVGVGATTTIADNAILSCESDFGGKYLARFVKLSFPVGAHCYCSELLIYGSHDISGAKAATGGEQTGTSIVNKYADQTATGAKDVLLSYIHSANGSAPITRDVWLPHVAYVKDGKIVDTLFDGYLFLPYVNFLYSGNTLIPHNKASYTGYFDTEFISGGNLDSLNSTVAEVGKALGNPDMKVKVYFSILEPVSSVTSFGVIDGKNISLATDEGRRAAIKWMVDEQLARFNRAGYEHLEVEGFYWFVEGLSMGYAPLTNYICDYAHELGYSVGWIPYYQASGYNSWQDYGFDYACYQPNYAFNNSIPISRIYSAAAAAYRYGMCVELEIGGNSASDVTRLKNYFAVGAETGFMKDASHFYYQGGVPGSFYNSYTSKDKFIHSLYDDLYAFIKGTFQVSGYTISDAEAECVACGTANGKINIVSETDIIAVSVTLYPKYGDVTVSRDGSFVYTPRRGFTGEDYFTVAADCGLGLGAPATIKITVKPE